jgi:hypothetical protein
MANNQSRVNRMDDRILKYYQYNFNRGTNTPPMENYKLNMMSLEQIYKIFKKMPLLQMFTGHITGGFGIYMILKNINQDLAQKMIEDSCIATEDVDIKFLMYNDNFIHKHRNHTIEQFMLGTLKTDKKIQTELATLQVADKVTNREMDSIFEIINDNDPPEGSDIHKIQSTLVEDGKSLLSVYDGSSTHRIGIRQITAYVNNKFIGVFNAVLTCKFDMLFMYPNFLKSHKYYYDYIGLSLESEDNETFIQMLPRHLTDTQYYDKYIDSEFIKFDLVYILCDALVKLQLNKYSNRIPKLIKIIGRLYLLYLPEKYEGDNESFKKIIKSLSNYDDAIINFIDFTKIIKDKFDKVIEETSTSTQQDRKTVLDALYNSEDYQQELYILQEFGNSVSEMINTLIKQLFEVDNFNKTFSYIHPRVRQDNISQHGGGENNNNSQQEPIDIHNYKYYYNGLNILKSIDNNEAYKQLNIETVEKDKEYTRKYYFMDMIVSSLIISKHLNFEVKDNKVSLQAYNPIISKDTNVSHNKTLSLPNHKQSINTGNLTKLYTNNQLPSTSVQAGGKHKTKRKYNRKRKLSKRRKYRKK